MRKRNNSTGYITFRKDRKKWEARFYEINPVNNKRKTKSRSFDSQEEAKKYLESLMYQKENPLYIKNNGIPFCEFMRNNLKLKLETNQITEVTYLRSIQTIEQIDKFAIGKEKIDEITTEELQAFMNYHKYLSNSSINKLYQQLGTTFRLAINKGYMMRNPMAGVLKPKSDKLDKKVRALTFEEQQLFTNFLLSKDIKECKYKNVFLIQMFMGLRIGEALALKTTDIDLKNKKMYISKTLTKDDRGNTIMGRTTKTYAGKRVLPIPKFLLETLIEQMKVAEENELNEEKMLFKPENTKYTDRENVNTELKRLLKRHFGIEDITTHSLRHTYGTRCIESGMQPIVVQKMMGHADIRVTLNTYTSVFDEFKAKEIEKVNKYLIETNIFGNVEQLEEKNPIRGYELESEEL